MGQLSGLAARTRLHQHGADGRQNLFPLKGFWQVVQGPQLDGFLRQLNAKMQLARLIKSLR